jgi:hypothetical protein
VSNVRDWAGVIVTEEEGLAAYRREKKRAEAKQKRAGEKHRLEYDVARYIQKAAQPTTREVATAMKWPLARTRALLLGMAGREFFPYGTLAHYDTGAAAEGSRIGARRAPSEYVWFFT